MSYMLQELHIVIEYLFCIFIKRSLFIMHELWVLSESIIPCNATIFYIVHKK